MKNESSEKQPLYQRLHERAEALKRKAAKNIEEVSRERKRVETFQPDLSKSNSRTRATSGSSVIRNASRSRDASAQRATKLYENASRLEAKKRKLVAEEKQAVEAKQKMKHQNQKSDKMV